MTQGLKYIKLKKIWDGQYQNVKILVHSSRQWLLNLLLWNTISFVHSYCSWLAIHDCFITKILEMDQSKLTEICQNWFSSPVIYRLTGKQLIMCLFQVRHAMMCMFFTDYFWSAFIFVYHCIDFDHVWAQSQNSVLITIIPVFKSYLNIWP